MSGRLSGYVRYVLVGLLIATPTFAAEPDKAFPSGVAGYVVQVQGQTVWSRQADRPLPPASLTKVMTALLFLESRLPLDGVATISANAARATGTRLKLHAGEQMSAGDLLAASLLVSANDACLALAEHTAGSKDQFNAAMNRRAKELGLANSNFTNPCGHDEPKHRSSARDLAALTAVAMRQPVFAKLVNTIDHDIKTIAGRSFKLENSNALLGRYRGAMGVKTGFTPGAGNCLIAVVERNGVSVLLVVLNAPNRWWESVAMLDRALEQPLVGSVAR